MLNVARNIKEIMSCYSSRPGSSRSSAVGKRSSGSGPSSSKRGPRPASQASMMAALAAIEKKIAEAHREQSGENEIMQLKLGKNLILM